MRYKIIFADYDKTLTTTNREITDRTKKALAAFRERGGKFVLCTTRNLPAVQNALHPLGIETDFFILNQGATIYDVKNERFIYRSVLDREQTAQIVRFIRKFTERFLLFNDKTGVCKKQSIYIRACHRIVRFPAVEIGDRLFDYYDEDGITQVFVGSLSKLRMRLIFAAAKLRFGRSYELGICDAHAFNISAKGVTKGAGITKTLEYLGLGREDAVAFGDSESDASMFEAAALGVAMGNSMPELIRHADDVCGSCDEDGLAVYVEEKLL